MQKAIRNYIEEEREKRVAFEDIEKVIDRVERNELKRARKKQYIQWRKSTK